MEHADFWTALLKDSGRMEHKEFLLRLFPPVFLLVLKQKGSLNPASSYFLWLWTVMEDMACYLSYTPGRILRFLWSWYYELWAAQAELTLFVPNNLPPFAKMSIGVPRQLLHIFHVLLLRIKLFHFSHTLWYFFSSHPKSFSCIKNMCLFITKSATFS